MIECLLCKHENLRSNSSPSPNHVRAKQYQIYSKKRKSFKKEKERIGKAFFWVL
jgi:hypothetical protein